MKRPKKKKPGAARRRRAAKNARRKDARRSSDAPLVGDAALAPSDRRFRVRVDVTSLELAKGHDGLFRGEPEPVVVLAAWVVAARGPLLIGRTLVHLPTPTSIPVTLIPTERHRLEAEVHAQTGSFVIVLACALEEDDGRGVREVYAAMERKADLTLLLSEGDHLHGGPLDEFARSAGSDLHVPRPIHVSLDHAELATLAEGDDWIAAAACVVPCDPRPRRSLRFPLRAADGKNDWTLRAELTLRG